MSNHYQSILVAVDGSKEAEFALQKAINSSKRNVGSKLTIVNVVDSRVFETLDSNVYESIQADATELLNTYKAKAQEAGLENVETLVELGSPKVVIAGKIAEKVNADLIVCGATGRNAVERLLMGSVSQAIVRGAKCDVLVIRTETGEN